MKVAVIGGGVAGIGSAKVLKRYGYECTIFEKSDRIGGIWNTGYLSLPIQSFDYQYHFTDFPCGDFFAEQHPTAEEILKYLAAAVEYYDLDVQLNSEVRAMDDNDDGWLVEIRSGDGKTRRTQFNYVVVSSGLFTKGSHYPVFPGQSEYKGEIHLGPFIDDLNALRDKKVVIVGFGKSAIDLVALTAEMTKKTIHLFRTPRWTLAQWQSWSDFSFPIFCRMGTLLVTSWSQPHLLPRLLHKFKVVVRFFWLIVSWLLKIQILKHAQQKCKDTEKLKLVESTFPEEPIFIDRPCIVPYNAHAYYEHIMTGNVTPMRGNFHGFYSDGIVLDTGQQIPCDVAVLSLGIQTPDFYYLPVKYRYLMEREGGVQLYRHVLHPRIPRMAFIGHNQSFLFMPSVEISALWMVAVWRNELQLPSLENMEDTMRRVTGWKRKNQAFDPTMFFVTHSRYQQFIDTLLGDIGVNPFRKMPNIFAEMFGKYGSSDYREVFSEYDRHLLAITSTLRPLDVDT